MTLPTIPTRTDAAVACKCGNAARISAVATIPDVPDRMRHTYTCAECGQELVFDVAKRAQEKSKEQGQEKSQHKGDEKDKA